MAQVIATKCMASICAHMGACRNRCSIHPCALAVAIFVMTPFCGCKTSTPDNETPSYMRFCCAHVCERSGTTMLRLGALLHNSSDSCRYLDCIGGVFLLHNVTFRDVESGVELPLRHEVVNDSFPDRIEFNPGEEMYMLNVYILPSLKTGSYRVSFALPWDVDRRHELSLCVHDDMETASTATSVKNLLPISEIEQMGREMASCHTNSIASICCGFEYDLIRREILSIARLGSTKIYNNGNPCLEVPSLPKSTGGRTLQKQRVGED